MTFVKIPLIFLDALWMRISATPPNGVLPKAEHLVPDWREKFLKSLAWPCVLLRCLYWTAGIVETLVIISSLNPTGPVSSFFLVHLLKDPSKVNAIGQITPPFLLGNILTLLGTLLRVNAFRTLGRLFTFELAIFEDHALVVDGPYSVIRHPSYAGLIMTIIGAYMNAFAARGGWVRDSGVVLDTLVGKFVVGAWITIAVAVVVSLLLRIPGEDRLLRKRFGEEWDDWAKEVPFRLLPGIY